MNYFSREQLFQIANNIVNKKNSLNESILDPVNKTRCREIFNSNDVMKPEITKFIIDSFEDWYNNLEEGNDFDIVCYKMIGSSTGYQYSIDSDIDLQVIVKMHDGHSFNETNNLINILPNGNNVPGTLHPINYFLIDSEAEYDMNKVENLYNLITKKWEKKSEIKDIKVPVLYVREISRIFTDSFDLLFSRFDRDIQYLKDAESLNVDVQDISENEKADAISKSLDQVKGDIDSLRIAWWLLHGFRTDAYENKKVFKISIEYMDNDDPRRSINEAIYKTLDKFNYRDKIWDRINAGREIIEKYEANSK